MADTPPRRKNFRWVLGALIYVAIMVWTFTGQLTLLATNGDMNARGFAAVAAAGLAVILALLHLAGIWGAHTRNVRFAGAVLIALGITIGVWVIVAYEGSIWSVEFLQSFGGPLVVVLGIGARFLLAGRRREETPPS